MEAIIKNGELEACSLLLLSDEAGLADTWLDLALARIESGMVHLLIAHGAQGLDIRRAYSAVDRYKNPQPFRLMETFRLPPLAHLALAYLPTHWATWKNNILRQYLEKYPTFTQTDISDGLRLASDSFLKNQQISLFDPRAPHAAVQACASKARERGDIDVGIVIAGLRAIADEYELPWSVDTHHLFPKSFRAAVECFNLVGQNSVPSVLLRHGNTDTLCDGFDVLAQLPSVMWVIIFSFLDRSSLEVPPTATTTINKPLT
mmetsp:Transcript_21880/g.44962  ORF Transcript_21880/g.44962 Transcript_21880/m.44962 type:complete len:261 (+) Transcript_21880:151-933(+)